MSHVKNNKYLGLVFLLFLINSCSTEEETKSTSLPIIGHHDIATEKFDHYDVGDTIYHEVPSFEYVNHDSLIIKSHDLENRVWIAKFFFANCPTICPPMTASMRELHDSLQGHHDDLYFLAFSIDPEKDSPSRLRDYKEAHGIHADNWHFLTGVDEDETHYLGVHGFYIHAAADEAAPGGFAHSSNFVLVDKNKHIRGVYDGLDPDERSRLIKDVKKLLK